MCVCVQCEGGLNNTTLSLPPDREGLVLFFPQPFSPSLLFPWRKRGHVFAHIILKGRGFFFGGWRFFWRRRIVNSHIIASSEERAGETVFVGESSWMEELFECTVIG